MVDVVTTLTIDASGVEPGGALYIRVMRAMEAARDRMINQDAALSAAIQQQSAVMISNSQKIEAVRRNWERMVGSIDPGVAAARRFGTEYNKAITTADAAVKRLGVDQQFANRVLAESIQLARQRAVAGGDQSQRMIFGMTQAGGANLRTGDPDSIASAQMLRGLSQAGREAASSIQAVALSQEQMAKSAQMLRAQMRPYETQVAHLNAELAQYQVMLNAGAISAEEFAFAQGHINKNMVLAKTNLTGVATAGRLSNFEMANLSFQLNDIAVMAASGQNPFTLIMQQGMQIAQIMAVSSVATQGLKGAMSALGQGIMSMVASPLNRLVVALAVIAGAIAFMWSKWNGDVKSVEDSLERHEKAIRGLKDAWGDVAAAQRDYIDQSPRVAQFEVDVSASKLRESLQRELQAKMGEFQMAIREREAIQSLPGTLLGVTPLPASAFEKQFMPFHDQIVTLIDDMEAGRFTVLQFQEAIVSIAKNDSANKALSDTVNLLMGITEWAAKAQRALEALSAPPARKAEESSMEAMRGFNAETFRTLEQITEAARVEQDSRTAITPEDQADIARRRERLALIGESITRAERFLRVEIAGLMAYQDAEKDLREAEDARSLGRKRMVLDSRLELELLGKSAHAATFLRVQYELMAEAIDAARKRDGVVSAEEQEDIRKTAMEMAGLAAQIDATTRRLDAMKDRFEGIVKLFKEGKDAVGEFFGALTSIIDMQQMLEIDLRAIGVKNVYERAQIEADRAREQALNSGSLLPEANVAAEIARTRTIAEGEFQIKEALDARIRSMQQSIASQELNLRLIGATVGEAARLRTEYQLIVAAEEAARSIGGVVSDAELKAIQEAADAAGRLAENIAAATMMDELLFARSLMAMNEIDRAVAEALRAAGLDINTPLGKSLGEHVRFNKELEISKGILADMEGFASDVFGGFLSDLREGKSLMESLGNVLNKIADKLLDMALNEIFTGLFGSGSETTMTSMGGIGGLLNRLFGRGGAPAAPPIGGVGDVLGWFGFGSGGAGAARGSFRAAQDIGGGSVQQQVWNFFAAKGLAPHQIAGIMGNVGAESAFNPLAMGDHSKMGVPQAFGLFQWNDRKHKLFDFIGGKENLGDINKQLEFAFHEFQTSENVHWQRLLGSRNVREATSAVGGFERARGWSMNNPEGIHNWTGRLAGAEQAFAKHAEEFAGKFDGTLTNLTNNMGSVVTGFGGQFGDVLQGLLSQFGGGGGGTFGFIRRLIGGGHVGLFDNGGWVTSSSGLPISPRHRLITAEVGEYVQSKSQASSGGSSPSVVVNLNNRTSQQFEAGEPRQDSNGEINIDLLEKKMEKNLVGKYNLRRAVGRR